VGAEEVEDVEIKEKGVKVGVAVVDVAGGVVEGAGQTQGLPIPGAG